MTYLVDYLPGTRAVAGALDDLTAGVDQEYLVEVGGEVEAALAWAEGDCCCEPEYDCLRCEALAWLAWVGTEESTVAIIALAVEAP